MAFTAEDVLAQCKKYTVDDEKKALKGMASLGDVVNTSEKLLFAVTTSSSYRGRDDDTQYINTTIMVTNEKLIYTGIQGLLFGTPIAGSIQFNEIKEILNIKGPFGGIILIETTDGQNFKIDCVAKKEVEAVTADLQAAIEQAKSMPKGGASSADEILKYKQLLDAGVISQAEFDAKKKQLLGL